MPVGGVNWYEAMAYAEFAGKGLPTVYEWDQAAGTGVTVNSDVLQLSNFGGKAPGPVGAHRGMNPFGTFDMAGNLKEWTSNAAGDERYILGGAWDEPAYAFNQPDARSPFARESMFGFRCVQRPTAPPERSFVPLTLGAGGLARASAPAGDETYKVFLNLHTPPPYQVVAIMGGATITDGIRTVDDFDYPYEFIVRSGRAVIIPAYSGTLERGPSPYGLRPID